MEQLEPAGADTKLAFDRACKALLQLDSHHHTSGLYPRYSQVPVATVAPGDHECDNDAAR
jgi:hypothetical protein